MHAKTKFLIAAVCTGLLFTTLVARGQQTPPPVSTSQSVTPDATHKVLSNATHKVLPTDTKAAPKPTPPPPASTDDR